ncbi:hypothetical protein C1141_19910, partial [Vibrio agarivorans]
MKCPLNPPYKFYLMVSAIALMNLLISMDMTMMNLALNDIAKGFDIPVLKSQMVITVYYLTSAITFIVFGKLADYFGYKRVFLFGIIFFTIASFIAGNAQSLNMLILARILQGIGFGATLGLSSLLVVTQSPSHKKGIACSLLISVSSIGQILGPTVGGYIIHYWGWSWTFLINVPVGIISFLGSYYFTQNDKKENLGTLNIKEIILFLLGTGGLLSAITLYQEISWDQSLLLISVGVLSIGYYINQYKSLKLPLIENNILKNKEFIRIVAIRFSYMVFVGAWLYFMPIYLQNNLNY